MKFFKLSIPDLEKSTGKCEHPGCRYIGNQNGFVVPNTSDNNPYDERFFCEKHAKEIIANINED